LRIPTYTEKVVPEGGEGQRAFLSDALRETARSIPTLDATAKAKRGFAGAMIDISTRMKDAYNAKQLADADTELMRRYAELETTMKSPEYRGENHWSTWGEYYDKESTRINNDVAKKYDTMGMKARSGMKDRGKRYKVQYGVNASNRSTGAQLQELEGAVNKKQKEYKDLGIASYINGNMKAVADSVNGYTGYLVGQVKAGVLTEAEAKAKVAQLESEVMGGIWDWRVSNKPGSSWDELAQMEKNYLKAAKIGDTETMGFYGMDLEKITYYKDKARKNMVAILNARDKEREAVDKATKEATKKLQNENAKQYYILAEKNQLNTTAMKMSGGAEMSWTTKLDSDYRMGVISEEDYKAIKAVARTTANKKGGSVIEKDLVMEAYKMLSKNKPLGSWIEANKENLTTSVLKDLVKKNGDRQYKRGLSVIEERLKPHPLDNRTGVKMKKAKFVKAVLKYDDLLAGSSEDADHTDLALEAVQFADPSAVRTPEQEKRVEQLMREKQAELDRIDRDGSQILIMSKEGQIESKYRQKLKNEGLE